MTEAVRWVWELDATKAEQMIYKLVGGDDNGGEWN